jgi:hypothetical protein
VVEIARVRSHPIRLTNAEADKGAIDCARYARTLMNSFAA